jgi:TRAP-type uncharacterized transport system substrate-binding protein
MKYSAFLLLVFMGLLTGCGASQGNIDIKTVTPTPSQSATAILPVFSFKIASTPDSGLGTLDKEISQWITESVPNVKAELVGADSMMENLKLLTSGKVGMAFGYDYHAILANKGKLASVFPNAQPEKISVKCGVEITRMPFPEYSLPVRIISPIYEQLLFVVAASNSGVAALSDLKGKRVSTGAPQSATEELAGYVLKGLEINEGDFFRESMNLEEALSALMDKKVDAVFWSGRTSDLANISADLILLPITESDAETVIRVNPDIFHIAHIPAGRIPSIHNDMQTIAVTLALLAMPDFPSDIIVNSLGALEKQGLTEDALLLNSTAAQYLHEGAAAYFTNSK